MNSFINNQIVIKINNLIKNRNNNLIKSQLNLKIRNKKYQNQNCWLMNKVEISNSKLGKIIRVQNIKLESLNQDLNQLSL